jgi:hypothetical protein
MKLKPEDLLVESYATTLDPVAFAEAAAAEPLASCRDTTCQTVVCSNESCQTLQPPTCGTCTVE